MAHAASTASGRRHHRPTAAATHRTTRDALTRAVLAGLVYGVWAAFIERQTGPVDAGNVFFGILCGALFAGVLFVMGRVGPRLQREVRAAAYGVLTGAAAGFLHSLTGSSVLRAAVVGLFVGMGVGLAAFYRYYTRED